MDFLPRLVRKHLIGRDEYETFSSLLERANTWYGDNSDIQLVSCETMTWFGSSHKEIFSDSTSFRRVSGTMTFMRGLRFWYLTRLVPTPSHGHQGVQAIQCQIFPARVTENFAQLMKRVNDKLSENASIGRILGAEVIRLNREDSAVNTELTFWKEDSGDTKQIVFALRVYSVLSENPIRETIGYQDFLPEKTTRSKENRGYELYSDVMDRAARWIARQQGVRFTNLQTIPIKIKKNSAFEERCAFTEHGRRATPYLHVIRAFFVIRQAPAPGVTLPELAPARLTYRTFAPIQVAATTGSLTPRFEDIRTFIERINNWLRMTGARLFSVETVPVRLSSSANFLGADATFVPNQDSSYTARFLFNIRIYLSGDYVEPPQAACLVY